MTLIAKVQLGKKNLTGSAGQRSLSLNPPIQENAAKHWKLSSRQSSVQEAEKSVNKRDAN